MAVARTTSIVFLGIFRPRQNNLLSPFRLCSTVSNNSVITFRFVARGICFSRIQCAASYSGDDGKKVSARLSQVQQLLKEAEERAFCSDDGPVPRITIDHVTVSFARSGGPGGQNVNKVNTKVDMRFNVKNAYWLSDRIREKIMQMEKNRINKDGELVISSTKTRTQKGNIEDALEKLQAIIDAASYVPPPPSEEQKKKIEKILGNGDQVGPLPRGPGCARRVLGAPTGRPVVGHADI